MRSEWRTAKLVDVAAKKRWALNGGPFGSKLSRKHYGESGVPVIRGTNLSGASKFSFDDFVYVCPVSVFVSADVDIDVFVTMAGVQL